MALCRGELITLWKPDNSGRQCTVTPWNAYSKLIYESDTDSSYPHYPYSLLNIHLHLCIIINTVSCPSYSSPTKFPNLSLHLTPSAARVFQFTLQVFYFHSSIDVVLPLMFVYPRLPQENIYISSSGSVSCLSIPYYLSKASHLVSLYSSISVTFFCYSDWPHIYFTWAFCLQ